LIALNRARPPVRRTSPYVLRSDSTKEQSSAGVFGVRKLNRMPTELIPGLVVEVRGGMNGQTLMAHEILFTDDDLKAAQQARAAHASH
jgi:hypothetical protein